MSKKKKNGHSNLPYPQDPWLAELVAPFLKPAAVCAWWCSGAADRLDELAESIYHLEPSMRRHAGRNHLTIAGRVGFIKSLVLQLFDPEFAAQVEPNLHFSPAPDSGEFGLVNILPGVLQIAHCRFLDGLRGADPVGACRYVEWRRLAEREREAA